VTKEQQRLAVQCHEYFARAQAAWKMGDLREWRVMKMAHDMTAEAYYRTIRPSDG
jgi:hypothetical protein